MLFTIFLILIFLCWGSFLNVVAYRSISDLSFFIKRSVCPKCKKLINWYDNIPIISWIILKTKCRHCKEKISFLYPLIEGLTAIVMTALFYKTFDSQNIFYFISYFIFFSALIVATRTDLQALVIPQVFSIWLVPVGLVFAYFNFIKISLLESFLGAVIGYGVLWLTAKLFKYFAKKEGLGVGDMELLAMIGAFLGPLGAWFSLLLGSVLGLMLTAFYLILTRQGKTTQIPFGPFLALGATFYFFFETVIVSFFL